MTLMNIPNQKPSCSTCGLEHIDAGFSFHFAAPAWWRPEYQNESNSFLNPETCVIRGDDFFVRALLTIAVNDADPGTPTYLEWGVWVSLSADNFRRTENLWTLKGRENEPAYAGWLSSELPGYPDTVYLRTKLQTQSVGHRPTVIVEPTSHPLALEQQKGITSLRAHEIADIVIQQA